MKKKIYLAIVLIVGALPFISQAQQTRTEFERQVRRQIGAIIQVVSEDFESSHDLFVGSMRQGETKNITYTLTRNVQYAIVGVCDSDCPDLDLRLYDPSGDLISSDTTEDDRPLVTVTPSTSGTFTVRVIMYQCSNNPCWYGVQGFRRI